MNASFEEKSVWIQLVSMLTILGSYFVVAGLMMSKGVATLPAYVPLFVTTVALMVAVLAASHIVAAVASRPDGRDERDRLIGWRAESNSSWILAAGALAGITGMVLSFNNVWIAHLLLFSLFLFQLVAYVFQLVYYRRGI